MRVRHSRRGAVLAALTALALAAAGGGAVAAAGDAPGAGPGTPSYYDLGRKDCLGTARDTASKVWYTVADGVLSDVYEPTIDNTDVQTLQYAVTDGSTFTDLQTRDMTYTVRSSDGGMTCEVTSTDAAHGFRLTTTYVTDPVRDTVLMRTRIGALPGRSTDVGRLRVYARLDAHANGDGGGGTDNAGANSGVVRGDSGVPVVSSDTTVTQAANRDYAVPTSMALDATSAGTASVGYAGTASDGLSQLDSAHRLSAGDSAPNGHIVATEDVTPRHGGEFTLALGFGRTPAQAAGTAAASLRTPFDAVRAAYAVGWAGYDASLDRPPAHVPGIAPEAARSTYYLDANVLKASEDKTYPGAIVASLASPWGQAVSGSSLAGGKPVYFGSYREVFGRDLYEAFTGLMADGDTATARAATRFLFDRQQTTTGEIPRNSLVNGETAPDTGGDQLDETAYPILMAYLSGLGGDKALWADHIKPAADFLVSHGPSYGVERWEEQSGYSPSTIAAEIAGLTAAADLAHRHGDPADALLYQATADDFQREIKHWTVTTDGPDSSAPYFIRLSKTGDPDTGTDYGLGNGGPTLDQRTVLDGGFQELVRLGELPSGDPAFTGSLKVLDDHIAVNTPSGTGYYRYGDDAAKGSADGYGDCSTTGSQTSCATAGQPWPTTDTGTGHLWPVLSGERAESALATGDRGQAARLLGFMMKSASGVGLVPEQVWEDPDLAASPYGSDPATASIGFADGRPAGSASPLTWAQAQELRLIVDLGSGRTVDRPALTTHRYVDHAAPAAVPVALTSPADGSTVEGATTTVRGTTTPGASVVVGYADTDTGATARTVTTRADSTGAFTADVAVGLGANSLTAAASTASGGTGYARGTVVGDFVGGTTVLDTADPAGDDNGPGTYRYPTDPAFAPGSFDVTRFQVFTSDGTVYLRTTLKNLVPTFGNTMGAQLLDIYVHDPAASGTSTAAAYPSRGYTVAPADAWSQRLEVQGFAAPVWDDPSGDQVGTAAAVASAAAHTITVALPQARFGTPGSGWTFTVALTGQDGGTADQARVFAPTAQQYAFGICPAGGSAAICSADPSTVPEVMDTIAPAGVEASTELDPTRGPVVLRGITVP